MAYILRSGLRSMAIRAIHGLLPIPVASTVIKRQVSAAPESTDVSRHLSCILKTEIHFAEDVDCKVEGKIPDSFPFEIEDGDGEKSIVLKRTYQNETIEVHVGMTQADKVDEDEDAIPLVVSITKGRGLSLQFGITSFPNEISIDSFSIILSKVHKDKIAYGGPDFNDLDENLQMACHKYLEIRGIKPCIGHSLCPYIRVKENNEYLMWLKNFKYFIEDQETDLPKPDASSENSEAPSQDGDSTARV